MLTKNVVKHGDIVQVVPLGMLCEVKYNSRGVISGLFPMRYDPSSCQFMLEDKIDEDTQIRLQKRDIIPSRITNAKEGVNVLGVIECPDVKVEEGIYPHCLYEKIHEILRNGNVDNIKFAAFDVEDGSSRTSYQRNAKLEYLGFNRLNSFVVARDTTNKFLKSRADHAGFPFVNGYFIVTRNGDPVYVPELLKCSTVLGIKRSYNESGFILADITLEDSSVVTVPYTVVVNMNVQRLSTIIVEQDTNKVVYCSSKNSNSKRVDNEIYCEFCGTKTYVPSEGFVTCSYDNCPSRMYPVVCRFMDAFDLDRVSFDEYMKLVESKDFISVCDIFNIPGYENVTVSCTLGTLLDVLCPMEVNRTPDFFQRFVKIAGSIDSVKYYIKNVDAIKQDMKSLDQRSVDHVCKWLEVPENVLNITEFIDNIDNVKIVDNDPVLKNVAPIFLNKGIYLLGVFNHGSYDQVTSILESYGAEVVSKLDNRCSCVLVGHLDDVDNNPVVQRAVELGIPLYREDDFFKSYEIDKDIEHLT